MAATTPAALDKNPSSWLPTFWSALGIDSAPSGSPSRVRAVSSTAGASSLSTRACSTTRGPPSATAAAIVPSTDSTTSVSISQRGRARLVRQPLARGEEHGADGDAEEHQQHRLPRRPEHEQRHDGRRHQRDDVAGAAAEGGGGVEGGVVGRVHGRWDAPVPIWVRAGAGEGPISASVRARRKTGEPTGSRPASRATGDGRRQRGVGPKKPPPAAKHRGRPAFPSGGRTERAALAG